MLNVFHVDGGRMIYLDIGYATGQVGGLQRALQEETAVPQNEQVLLVSGGEILDSNKPVTHYGAGQESNPIFMVSRYSSTHLQRSLGISTTVRSEGTEELLANFTQIRQELQNASSSRPTLELVQRYAEIGKQLAWSAERGLEMCKRLVEEQHLLHQGWSALVANLEDTEVVFGKRVEKFGTYFLKFRDRKPRARELLRSFPEDLRVLRQIPLPSNLVPEDQQRTLGEDPTSDSKSLLDWITAKDTTHSITDVAEEAKSLLDQIEDSNLDDLQGHRDSVRQLVSLLEMKEIKGISKRLSQLDEFQHKAENLERETKQFCDAVVQQEQKALTTARDMDTMQGACQIQRDTLVKVAQNQQSMTEIASKFRDSKVELLENVRRRLADWITQTYQMMHEGNNHLTVYGEKLMGAKKRLDLLKQIHEAPTVYASALTEVLRRKTFSGDFRAWATVLVEKCQKLREEEAELRMAFQGKLDKHFLKLLFPGMNEEMPGFATDNPPGFDLSMPPLTADDLRMLRQSAVSLAPLLQVNQRNMYEILAVPDPQAEDSFVGMKREASFFCNTPPKFLGASRKFPSSTWLSGDENLDFSPTGGLMARSPPSSRALEFESFPLTDRLSDISPPQASGSRDTGFEDRQSTPSSGGVYSRQKSNPIGIPTPSSSRAASDAPANNTNVMSTSKQLSEKSSRFGTPEEDLPESEGDEMATSPPEMISRSQLKAEIGQLTVEMVEKVEELSSKGPSEEQKSESFVAKTLGVLTQTSFVEEDSAGKLELPTLLQEKRSEVEKLEGEVFEQRQEIETLTSRVEGLTEDLDAARNVKKTGEVKEEITALRKELEESKMAEGKLRDTCTQQKGIVQSTLRKYAEELHELKDLLTSCSKDNEESVEKCKDILKKSGQRLESNLQVSVSQAQDAIMKIQRYEWDLEKERIIADVKTERLKTLAAEKQVDNYEALIRQKEEVLGMLQEELSGKDEKWRQKLEEDKSEIIKQLTIEHELQLDAMREGWRNELQEKEAVEAQLKDTLKEKNDVIMQLRKEQDQLVVSQYDRDTRFHSSTETETEKKEQETDLKQMRSEMEREYRDKLQFLTKGMEEKNAALRERLIKEKEIELRMLKERHSKEVSSLSIQLQEMQISPRPSSELILETDSSATGNVMAASAIETRTGAALNPNIESAQMNASSLGLSSAPSPSNEESEPIAQIMAESVMPAESVASTSAGHKELGVQTRLRLKDMKQMITVMEMREGDTVLVTYSEQYESYVLISTGSTLYFPKEGSLKRMGLISGRTLPSESAATATRRPQAWAMARVVTKPEFCQIKKETNRYKLPMLTRFFRVEIEAVPGNAT